MPKYVNSNEAYKILIREGINISYPTALDIFRKRKLTFPDSPPKGTVLVDVDKLTKEIDILKAERENG